MCTATALTVPVLGQKWQEQGGIFIGSRLIEGQLHHIIAAELQHDITDVSGHNVESAVSEAGEINGHTDWRAGAQEDLMLAYINGREHFVRENNESSIYWSCLVDSHGWQWAVVFADGCVLNLTRHFKFRVRPFRRFVHSST